LNCTAELQNHCVPQQKSGCQLTGFWLVCAAWCCTWRRKVLFKVQGGGDEAWIFYFHSRTLNTSAELGPIYMLPVTSEVVCGNLILLPPYFKLS